MIIVSAVYAFGYGHPLGGFMLAVGAALDIVSSIGLLQRRQFGVVAFVAAYVVQALTQPFAEVIPGNPFLEAIRSNSPSLAELSTQVMSFAFLRFVSSRLSLPSSRSFISGTDGG